MKRNLSINSFVLIFYCFVFFISFSGTLEVFLRAQCQSGCLGKYSDPSDYDSKSLILNIEYEACKAACFTTSLVNDECRNYCQKNKAQQACYQGCNFMKHILNREYNSDTNTNQSIIIIDRIDLVCADRILDIEDSKKITANFALKSIRKDQSKNMMKHANTMIYLIWIRNETSQIDNLDFGSLSVFYDNEKRKLIMSQWHYLGSTINPWFTVEKLNIGAKYQFQIQPVNFDIVFNNFESNLLKIDLSDAFTSLYFEENVDIREKSGQNGPILNIEWYPSVKTPTCKYSISLKKEDQIEVFNFNFHVLDKFSTILQNLNHETSYQILIESSLKNSISVSFKTKSCLELTDFDFSVCPPGLVKNVEWFEEKVSGSIIVRWEDPSIDFNHRKIAKFKYLIKIKKSHSKMGIIPNDECKPFVEYLETPNRSILLPKLIQENCRYENISIAAISDGGQGNFMTISTLLETKVEESGTNVVMFTIVFTVLVLIFVSGLVILYVKIQKPDYLIKNPKSGSKSIDNRSIVSSQDLLSMRPAISESSLTRNRLYQSISNKQHDQLMTYFTDQSIISIDNTEITEADLSRHIFLEHLLSNGLFGSVWKAKCLHSLLPRQIAVKKVKASANIDEANKHLSNEIRWLNKIRPHQNVLKYFGAIHQPELMLLMELCTDGDLKTLLSQARQYIMEPQIDRMSPKIDNQYSDLNQQRFLSYCKQAAAGMEHLSKSGLIHRDIAARNMLITCRRLILKIADFGMCRPGPIFSPIQIESPMPVLWMAPETMPPENRFSTKSDIWSYGVLIWEIFSLGNEPYCELEYFNQWQKAKSYLLAGHRLHKLQNCDEKIYLIMRRCWHTDPKNRPDFSMLKAQFELLLESSHAYCSMNGNID